MSYIEGVEIVGLCDQYDDCVENMQKLLAKQGLPRAESYSGSKDTWKKMCENPDIDLIYITTPWSLHTPIYDSFELLTLNMARQGFFGEIIHAEGAYIHDLRSLNFDKNGYAEMWRLKENQYRNGILSDIQKNHSIL